MKSSALNSINEWINERFPLSKFIKSVLHEEIPGGASYSYTLGSASLFLFLILAFTGVWQMFVYVPTVDHAYASLSYLRLDIPFGWLIHGMHYWGANAFAIVVGLHMARVFIWGAYKKPRELVWLSGVVLLMITAVFMFTGPVLPWDKKGYWACKVGLNIAGNVPLIGSFLQSVFQGTEKIGQLTLTRMFAIHVEILPALLSFMVLVHLVAFRVHGSSGSWNEQKRKIKGEFWPEQIFKDMAVALSLFLLLIGLSAFSPAPFSGMADPLDVTYTPKPEWTFNFIYQLLKYFPGPLEPLGTVGIPLFVILLLLSVPFIDRNEERSPSKRVFVLLGGLLFAGFVLLLTFLGFQSKPPPELKIGKLPESVGKGHSPESSAPANGHLEHKSKPLGSEKEIVAKGQKIFAEQGCNVCHSINGIAAHTLGPDLYLALSKKKELTAEWLEVQITSPKTHNPLTMMPPYDHLKKDELEQLIAFLKDLSKMTPGEAAQLEKKNKPAPKAPRAPVQHAAALKSRGVGEAVHIVGNKDNGQVLFQQYCIQCHGIEGKGIPDSAAPPLNPINKQLFSENVKSFLENIDPYIQHGSPAPEKGIMPAFADDHSLTQPEISDIEAYILALNKVDRAKINDPGIDPKLFFFINAGAALAIALVYLFNRLRSGK